MAKGLIPLMLSSPTSTSGFGSRPSVSSNRRASYSPPLSPAHRRNASDVTPILKLSRPPVNIPSTSAEWKRSIAEIKRFHVTRRFRACSARCNEILTNLRNTSVVEPAYLICLSFYAATSLEMCARPLTPASSYRISLLQQARAHYERAAALIRTAEEVASSQTRSSSAASSLPSLHSPSGSVSSRAWTPDCGAATPTSTISRKSSLALHSSNNHHQDPRSCGKAVQKKKQVSFELPRDRTRWSFTLPEPVIRPDSPTLGFDDEYFAAGAMRQELPEVPVSNTAPTSSSSNKRASRQDLPGRGEPARSLARYCGTLASLKTQVTSHMVALDEILEADLRLQQQQQQEGHHQPPESPVLQDTASLMAAELDELRSKDRQARIDRLRMSGWKRKRFDASRYEQLCDVVMEELSQT
ncbi:hypothetical protein M406DRAFT_63072 [Cryphonectria parasitica EP155]|uniref:Uncharacterized protein n=1 Tax=Cryphonectria parasitica (strain ATCC 38755 / EP155) TaxID=660469 RepID=A0A9P5CT72_CRYP1|nr:uncharacterized protein M406DRAFT_63072 [Cryphonectria parasitica EP155]KAF3769116.1 hypothetical protein M406DRAFT_63072 [Cryphonectria parasitica EP155]